MILCFFARWRDPSAMCTILRIIGHGQTNKAWWKKIIRRFQKKNNTYCSEGVPSFGFYLNSSFASVIWFVSLTVKIEIANREKGGRRSGKSMSCCRTEGIVDLGSREGTVLFIDSGRQDSGGGAGQKDSLGIPLNLLCLGITCSIAMWK